MAPPLKVKRKLPMQVPVFREGVDWSFYILPPLVLAAVFAFCAYVPREVKPKTAAAPPAVKTPAARAMGSGHADPNASLPDYVMPQGCVNVLAGATNVSVSAASKEAPAVKAVDGSCANDGQVAVALPAEDEPAWWQVEAEDGKEFSGESIVIYGGGSQSPAGKLVGGFRVEVEFADGESASREFCTPGFALEGYELWKLDHQAGVQSIRVSALRDDTPVVLREVQLIGPAE